MITRYFGFPRCGKTTLLSRLAVNAQSMIDMGLSKYEYVYTNVPVNYPGIRSLKFENLGVMDYHDCVIFIDEARLFADCRNYKGFDDAKVAYFATHGHDRVDIHMFSHDVNDLDKAIRNVSENVIWVHKILGFTRYIRIPRAICFPPSTGEIIMGFRKPNIFETILCGRIFRRKPYYKYFDSWHTYGKRMPVVCDVVPGSPKRVHTLINVGVVTPLRFVLDKFSNKFSNKFFKKK